jgi:hypothetical protein
MLVFCNARIRYVRITIVDHTATLKLAKSPLVSEIQGPVSEATEAPIEIAVDGAGIKDVTIAVEVLRAVEDPFCLHIDLGVMEHALNEVSVPANWQTLLGMMVIVLVKIEADRQPLEYEGWQFGRISPPLLKRIPTVERLIKSPSNGGEGHLFEIPRIVRQVFSLATYKFPSFIPGKVLLKELIDGLQSDRQGKELIAHPRLFAMSIRIDLDESLQKSPNLLIIAVQYMRTMEIEQNAGLWVTCRVAMASDVISLFEHVARKVGIGELAGDHSTCQSCSHDQEMRCVRHMSSFTSF